MVVPVGSLLNGGVIIAGGMLGMLLGDRLPQRIRTIVFQGLGLCTLVLGFHMTLKTSNPLYMIGSVLIGGIVGEALRIEDRILRGGEVLKKAMRSGNARFTEGFLAATLLFCIGSMAIIGPLQEGLSGDRSVVLAKATLDGFASVALGAVYGSGVLFSSLPLVIYQGSITLFADSLRPYISDLLRAEIEAVGGVLIIGIGINLLELKQIRLSNLLPALAVIVVLCLALG